MCQPGLFYKEQTHFSVADLGVIIFCLLFSWEDEM